MMNILMIMSFMLSIIFLFMNHPLSAGFVLLMQTIMISMMTGLLNYNFWFSYILFLVMIGGMLILFIYMTSISSNKKFKFSMNIFMFLLLMMMSMLIISYLIDLYYMNYMNFNMNMFNFNQNIEYFSLNKFMNYPNYLSLLMLFIYLFITLIAVTKICNMKSGPLRQKF